MITSTVMHFFNEELLIADWIEHHRRFFDHAVLINHHSTDRSVEIAQSMLPENWKIVDSRLEQFGAFENDAEVQFWEQTLPGWKFALNTTEFMFSPDMRQILLAAESEGYMAVGSRAVCLIDKEQLPLERPIWRNRTHGFINYAAGKPVVRRWRYAHRGEHGRYAVGRHHTEWPATHANHFLHLHFSFSPWPEAQARKLQIQARIPESNKASGLGFEHITDAAGLDRKWKEYLTYSEDLLLNERFKYCYDELLK